MKVLIAIQIALTAFALIALAVQFEMGMHVHQMTYSDPARKVATKQCENIAQVLKYAVYVPWLIFTAANVGVRVGRKIQRMNAHDAV